MSNKDASNRFGVPKNTIFLYLELSLSRTNCLVPCEFEIGRGHCTFKNPLVTHILSFYISRSLSEGRNSYNLSHGHNSIDSSLRYQIPVKHVDFYPTNVGAMTYNTTQLLPHEFTIHPEWHEPVRKDYQRVNKALKIPEVNAITPCEEPQYGYWRKP